MTLAELLVRFKVAGTDEVKRGSSEAGDSVKRFGNEASEADRRTTRLEERLGTSSRALSTLTGHLRTATTAVAAFGAVVVTAGTAGGVMLGNAAFDAAAKLDGLTRGLASVSRDSADLTGQLDRLREVAKLPGLGFAEAVQGSVNLQAAGLSANLAERSMKAFGNALATVGKGKSDLEGVILAIQQIAAKGKVSAEEINQINERVPQIRAAMKAAFGTSDTEALGKMGIDTTQFITGVVKELEKLPTVSGGISNAVENMTDRIQQALVPLGNGIARALDAASPFIERLLDNLENVSNIVGGVLEATADSGVLGDVLTRIEGTLANIFGSDIQSAAVNFVANLAAGVANVATVLSRLPALFGELSGFLRGVWETLAENSRIAIAYVETRFQSLIKTITDGIRAAVSFAIDLVSTVVQGIVSVLQLVSQSIGSEMLKSLDQLNARAKAGSFQPATVGAPPPAPQFRGLPSLPSAFTDPSAFFFGGAGPAQASAYAEMIARSYAGPHYDLPEGLSYAGAPMGTAGGAGLSEVWASWDKSLYEIERNTRQTADAMELRRQSFGGGELGRAGVTAAELGGRSIGTMLPVERMARDASTDFERAVQKELMRRVGRLGLGQADLSGRF